MTYSDFLLVLLAAIVTINTIIATWLMHHAEDRIIKHSDHRDVNIERIIRMTAQDTINEITTQLAKSGTEIVGKIADLEAAVAAGETPDFTELKAAAQSLDDIVPDAVVVEPPVEPVEPPVEEPPTV